jgi:hypothetical protein
MPGAIVILVVAKIDPFALDPTSGVTSKGIAVARYVHPGL